MKAFVAFLALFVGLSAQAEGRWNIECSEKNDSKVINGYVEFDSVGWADIGLKLNRKMKVFSYFRAGEKEALSFVDRNEHAGATNSFSWYSIILVISKKDRANFRNGEEFKIRLMYRDNDSPTGAASFDTKVDLICQHAH